MLQLWINFLTCPWCHKILSHTMLNCDVIWCIVTRVALVILPSVLTTGCEIWFKGLSLNYVTCTIFLQQNDFATEIIFIWFGPITNTVMPYKHQGISIHQQLDCLLDKQLIQANKDTLKFHVSGLLCGQNFLSLVLQSRKKLQRLWIDRKVK